MKETKTFQVEKRRENSAGSWSWEGWAGQGSGWVEGGGCAAVLCKLLTLGLHLTHSVLVGYHPEHLPCFSCCLLGFAKVISLLPDSSPA